MATNDSTFKSKLRDVLSQHSGGIKVSDLPRLWLEKFGTVLAPSTFGARTLNQLLLSDQLKDVLRVKGDTIRQVFSLQVVEGFLRRSRQQLNTNQKLVTTAAVIQDTCRSVPVLESTCPAPPVLTCNLSDRPCQPACLPLVC